MLDNRQSSLVDMFPEHGAQQWDPWRSPNAGLGPPNQQTTLNQRIRRSNSLTPPTNNVAYPQDPWIGSVKASFAPPFFSANQQFLNRTIASSRGLCRCLRQENQRTICPTVLFPLKTRLLRPEVEVVQTRFTATITTARLLFKFPAVG